MPAESQMISANLDFYRIAEGGEADEFYRRAHQKPHFHKTWSTGTWDFDFGDFRRSARGK